MKNFSQVDGAPAKVRIQTLANTVYNFIMAPSCSLQWGLINLTMYSMRVAEQWYIPRMYDEEKV